MKKLFTLFLGAACSLTMLAATYTGQLVVNINGDDAAVLDNVAIQIDGSGNSYTLTLNNFSLGEGLGVGNIVLSDVPATTSGDLTAMAVNRSITITAGDDPNEMWLGPMLGVVPIHMIARFTATQLATTIDIDMTSTLGQVISVLFTTDTDGSYAAGFQLPNGNFEGWKASSGEPDHWHGFKSASGSLASSAKGTLGSSTDVRSGATGKCAVVTSGSTFGIVNNGTMTNGQLNAGSMSATNTANHSHMDKSSTELDKNNDPFYTALSAAPDAISFWLKFSQKTANDNYPYATVSTIVFDGTYYQDPENKNYENVAAKAANKKITVCDWTKFQLPFDYDTYVENNASAEAILITVSTNATPGKGSSGDQVWVDDMELLYFANVQSVTANGITLPTFDPDTHHYTVNYEGDALTLSGNNFAAVVEGRSAVMVKSVEALGGGNYRVAIGAVTPDLKTANLYTYDINRLVPLADAVATGGEFVNVKETLSVVFGDADESIVYATDGLGNWTALQAADEMTFGTVVGCNAVSGVCGTVSGSATNPVLLLSQAPTPVEDAPAFTDFQTIDLTEVFTAKANGIYNVHGYIDGDGRLRAYSGDSGAGQGQSLDIDTRYLPAGASLEAGKAYNMQAVFTLKEAWNGAPRRAAADDERYFDNYTIRPIEVAVATGVESVDAARTVAAVRYFDVAGREIAQPAAGVTITLTRYTDGTTSVVKSMK